MIELVTGHAGVDHIDSTDLRAKNIGMFGDGFFLLEGSGNEAISPASTITIPALEMVLHGWFARTDGTDQLSIDGTSQSMYRKDLIIAKYSISGNIETMTLEVKQGTASTTIDGAKRPTLTQNLTTYECPIYEVVVYQNNVQAVTCILEKIYSMNTIATKRSYPVPYQWVNKMASNGPWSGYINVGGFDIPKSGVYLIEYTQNFRSNSAGDTFSICITPDGTFNTDYPSAQSDCGKLGVNRGLTTQYITYFPKGTHVNLLAWSNNTFYLGFMQAACVLLSEMTWEQGAALLKE